jgi:hypothetical protein
VSGARTRIGSDERDRSAFLIHASGNAFAGKRPWAETLTPGNSLHPQEHNHERASIAVDSGGSARAV